MATSHSFRYDFNAPHELIGQMVGERYLVRSLIKRGEVASVFTADDVRTSRQVAVKVASISALVRRTGQHVADIVEQFESAAWHGRRLQNEYTVPLIDSGRTNTFLFVVASLLPGENLKTVLVREGRLDPLRALRFASHVVASLDETHTHGWVHGDVRPSTVFVHRDLQGGEVAMMMDHGIGRMMAQPLAVQLTVTGRASGVPDYLSPEQCLGKPTTRQCDFYGVGVLLFEMLCGTVPFRGRSQLWVMQQHVGTQSPRVSDVNPRLARYPGVDAVVDTCLAKSPEARFSSSRRLLAALNVAIEEYLGTRGRATETS